MNTGEASAVKKRESARKKKQKKQSPLTVGELYLKALPSKIKKFHSTQFNFICIVLLMYTAKKQLYISI